MEGRNRARLIGSGLSVDGYYTRPDPENLSNVHVNLAFSVGVFGDQPEDEVEFKLRFRRAELRLLIGPEATVLKSSCADGTRPTPVQFSEARAQRSSGDASIQLQSLQISGNVGASSGRETSHTATFEREDFRVVLAIKNGVPIWEVGAGAQSHLDGSPWPLKEKRAAVRFQRPSEAESCSIRAVVVCREEDLSFFDISQRSGLRRIAEYLGSKKDLAARQFLKKQLRGQYLHAANADLPYGEIGLADVILTME